MTPAQPPPPTNSNLPFQFSGIQTSMSIWESEVGFNVAATRQNAGTVRGAACGPPPPPPRWPLPPAPGGVNVPAGTDSADVIVVLGSEMDFRFAHGVGAASAALKSSTAMFAIIVLGPPGW